MPTKTRQRRKGKPLLRKRCMTSSNNQASLIDELESRQNDVLDQLAELNARVEELLNECLPSSCKTRLDAIASGP